MTVTDKVRAQPSFIGFRGLWNFEIKNAYPVTRLAFVGPPIARAHHDALVRPFFATEINHGVRDRRIALDAVGAGPEEKIAGNQFFEFECVFLTAIHRFERSRLAQPNVLLTRIPRHVANAVLRQDVKDETGAIHPAGQRIG